MSLRNWLRKEDLLTCQPALRAAGVKKPIDLCELLDVDIHEVGRNAAWKISTRRRMINSMNKLKKKHAKTTAVEAEPSKNVSRPKWKSAPKKRGSRNVLIANFRKNDDDRVRRRKSAKTRAAKKANSRKANVVSTARVPKTAISKRVKVSAMKSAPKKRGAHDVLIDNSRKWDNNRGRRRKSAKTKTTMKTKSNRAVGVTTVRAPETAILKRVKASALIQSHYKRKPAYNRKTKRKDDSKEESKSETKSKYRESTIAALSSSTRCRSRGSTVDLPSEEVVLCNISERLPSLKSFRDCCDAVHQQLLLCQTPKLPTQTQEEIGEEMQGLKNELKIEFAGALTQEKEYNLGEMKALIKLIEKFKIMIRGRIAKLEDLYGKLLKEKPNQDSDILRRMDEHRKTLAIHKDFAVEYLNAINELEASKEKLAVIDHKTFAEMKVMKQPPRVLRNLLTGICMIFGMSRPSWKEATSFICGRDMRNKLLNFDPKALDPKARNRATKFIVKNLESFNPVRVEGVNRKAVSLADWVEGLNGVFEVFMKLEKFPDGETILKDIQKAHSELKKNKILIFKMEHERNCWQNVLDQLRWDIKLLKQCDLVLNKIKARREKMMKDLEECENLTQYDEISLPENYMIPFEEACKKIRSQFGELTEAELKLVFKMIKKYFLTMIRLYKTYASLEGKKRQGLQGMSTTMWGVCCKSMELRKLSEEEAQDFIYEVFNVSAMKTMKCNKHSVDFATYREETQRRNSSEDEKKDECLTGVWQLGESTTHLWTIEVKFGGVFSGFIGSEGNATIEGEISRGNKLNFRIAWGKESTKGKLTAKCKAMQVGGTTLRVKYTMNNKKTGYWILKKTGAKVRKQNKGTAALQYHSFIEAIIRISVRIWNDLPPWKAIEALMEKHIAPRALANWDVTPETNDTVQRYFSRKEVKSVLGAIFRKYSAQKNRSTILVYPNWEKLVRKINASATGIFKKASLRTIQFSFFTSKVMFPNKGTLNELTYKEFICAVARLAFMMVTKSKSTQGVTVEKPKLSFQCQTMISWLKQKKW